VARHRADAHSGGQCGGVLTGSSDELDPRGASVGLFRAGKRASLPSVFRLKGLRRYCHRRERGDDRAYAAARRGARRSLCAPRFASWEQLMEQGWSNSFGRRLVCRELHFPCAGRESSPSGPLRADGLGCSGQAGLLVLNSRNWELVRDEGSGLRISEQLVERGGRPCACRVRMVARRQLGRSAPPRYRRCHRRAGGQREQPRRAAGVLALFAMRTSTGRYPVSWA